MITKNLYRYEDGEMVIITPEKRNKDDAPYMFRLIAEAGKIITDNKNEEPYCCVDVYSTDGYEEIDITE